MLTWFGLGNHFLKSLVRRQGGGSGWKGKCITDGRMRYNQLQEKDGRNTDYCGKTLALGEEPLRE